MIGVILWTRRDSSYVASSAFVRLPIRLVSSVVLQHRRETLALEHGPEISTTTSAGFTSNDDWSTLQALIAQARGPSSGSGHCDGGGAVAAPAAAAPAPSPFPSERRPRYRARGHTSRRRASSSSPSSYDNPDAARMNAMLSHQDCNPQRIIKDG
ncbi:uncharacterized protein [Procambarus clarkii]|uniref:uncharacterized protein isoform X5 n=1 Tax=Procambarus clarkii TaxID=6728 RepID=UPI001E6712B2|nr:uncharacterized protein LOC123746998 isoform X5 [Procambarus clarkii]